jgi:hypothetical protein
MLSRLGHISLLTLLVLPACARRPVATISAPDNVVASRWNATLSTPAAMQGVVQAQGRSWITSVDEGRKTRVDVELSNVTVGGDHPWVLRTGQCGMGGSELIRGSGNNALKVGGDGRAKADATMDRYFQTTGDYALEVLASSENTTTVIACGNFAPPNMSVPR